MEEQETNNRVRWGTGKNENLTSSFLPMVEIVPARQGIMIKQFQLNTKI